MKGDPTTKVTDDPLHFVIGRDCHGNWMAIETHGLGSGFFCSQRDAIHYAALRGAPGPECVHLTSACIEEVCEPRRLCDGSAFGTHLGAHAFLARSGRK